MTEQFKNGPAFRPMYPIIALFLIACTIQLQAQGEFVVQINPETGGIVKTGPAISGIEYIYADDRALNENAGSFFFPSAAPTKSIFQIKLADGSTLSSPPGNDLSTFQFDNSSGKFYGLQRNNFTDKKFLVEINPATGAATPAGPTQLPGSATYGGGYSTYDDTQHRYFFLAPPQILYTLDASNGSVLNGPDLALGSNQALIHFVYAHTAGILYGLVQDNNAGHYFLVTINAQTGQVTPVGSTVFTSGGNGSAAIDETAGRYYFLYQSSADQRYYIGSINLSTGVWLGQHALPKEDSDDNFFSLKFNRADQKLYGIHWDAVITTPVAEVQHTSVQVMPNPMREKVVFSFDRPLYEARLELWAPTGQLVQTVDAFSGATLELLRAGLPAGGYFFRVYEKNEAVFSGKLWME